MPKIKKRLAVCSNCMVNGEIICQATESTLKTGAWHCNRGALTITEARERKKRRDLMWQSYIKATKTHRFKRT